MVLSVSASCVVILSSANPRTPNPGGDCRVFGDPMAEVQLEPGSSALAAPVAGPSSGNYKREIIKREYSHVKIQRIRGQ